VPAAGGEALIQEPTAPTSRAIAAGSPNAADWVAVDLGTPRRVDAVKLYFLDDGEQVVPPDAFELEHWEGSAWKPVPGQRRSPQRPAGRRANVITFDPTDVQKLRVVMTHAPGGRSGLTEFEAWGDGTPPYVPAPPPAGNLAVNPKPDGFPKASASFSDRFGGEPAKAIDGKDDTGWAVLPQAGRSHTAIFEFEKPVVNGSARNDGRSWMNEVSDRSEPACS